MNTIDELNDPKLIQTFLSEMDKWGMIYRNILSKDDRTLMFNGEIYHNADDRNIYRYTKTKSNITNKRMKDIESFLNNNTFPMDFNQYFEFRKNKKDKVSSIEINEDTSSKYIKFIRHNAEVLEISMKNDEVDFIINYHESMYERINNQFDTLLSVNKLSVEEIGKLKGPEAIYKTGFKAIIGTNSEEITLIDPFDNTYLEEDNYEIVLKNTDLRGIEYKSLKSGIKASDIKANVYSSEGINEMAMIEFVIESSTLINKQCFIIVKY